MSERTGISSMYAHTPLEVKTGAASENASAAPGLPDTWRMDGCKPSAEACGQGRLLDTFNGHLDHWIPPVVRCRIEAVRPPDAMNAGMDVNVPFPVHIDPLTCCRVVVRSPQRAHRVCTFLVQLTAGIIAIGIDVDYLAYMSGQLYAAHRIKGIISSPQHGNGAQVPGLARGVDNSGIGLTGKQDRQRTVREQCHRFPDAVRSSHLIHQGNR